PTAGAGSILKAFGSRSGMERSDIRESRSDYPPNPFGIWAVASPFLGTLTNPHPAPLLPGRSTVSFLTEGTNRECGAVFLPNPQPAPESEGGGPEPKGHWDNPGRR